MLNKKNVSFFKKSIISFSLLSLILISIFGFITPKRSLAQIVPTISPDVIAFLTGDKVKSTLAKSLEDAAYALVRNVLNTVLGKIAYDTATYIATGGSGQEPLIWNQPVGQSLQDMGNAAAGSAIDAFAEGFGFDAAKLCEPSLNIKINLGLGLEGYGPSSPYEPTCTFTEFTDNWGDLLQDPSFDKYVDLNFDPASNTLGTAILATEYIAEQTTKAEKEAEIQRQLGAFKDATETVSGYIMTPGKMIEQQWMQANTTAAENSYRLFGSPIADSVSIFANTLTSKLFEQVQAGFLQASSSSLSSLVAGSTGGTTSGISAASAIYSSLSQPTFVTTGSYDVLSELSSCPEEGASSNNCVVGSTLQVAIENKWTTQDFMNYLSEVQGNTEFKFAQDDIASPEEGLSYRAILVLKKYRIIPVGWQLAAEYLRSEQSNETASLKNIMDCFNACGGSAEEAATCDSNFLIQKDTDGNGVIDGSDTPTNYSPFCRLVDPTWVLKAPENYCDKQVPGPEILYTASIDHDALFNTQEKLSITRGDYCADNRGCIQEEIEDVCTAYGYCSQEDRIYRSEGDACDAAYASCQTFTAQDGDNEGENVSYVKQTLNYNDCATDPGCKWYCLAKDAAGSFICKDQDTVYKVCADGVTNDAGTNVYYTEETCTCTITDENCWVPHGSPIDAADMEFRTCTMGSGATCTLSDNCGASNPAYDASYTDGIHDPGMCYCSSVNTCEVSIDSDGDGHDYDASDQSCTYTYDDVDAHTKECTLDSTCTTASETYASAGYCTADKIGDSCFVQDGQTDCVNDVGNTCTLSGACGTDIAYDTGYDYCTCNLTSSETCAVTDGMFNCTTESGSNLIIGTEDETDVTPQAIDLYYNASINLDNNLTECDAENASCNQYYRIKSDTNVLPNASFSTVGSENIVDDLAQDYLGFYANNGDPCVTDDTASPGNGECIGWNEEGYAAGGGPYVVSSSDEESLYSELANDYGQSVILPATTDAYISNAFETGAALANRTFTFAYRAALIGSSTGTPTPKFRIATPAGSFDKTIPDGLTVAEKAELNYFDTSGNINSYTTTYTDYYYTFTFPASVTETKINVLIYSTTDLLSIDIVQLSETSSWSGDFSDYGENNSTNLKTDYVTCDYEDVGCELYTPIDQEDAAAIPAQITNPYSEACGSGFDFSSADCNQCDGTEEQGLDYYVGCEFYQEVPLTEITPVDEDPTDWSLSDTIERLGIAQRTGYYCEGTQISCFPGDPDNYCAGANCVNTISLIPSTADTCSAAAVGCEEYTNLNAVADGGEGIEYYSQIKQCVNSTDADTYTYHVWEGSDSEGYRMVLYTLKKSNLDNGPCTHLDLEAESATASCTDSADTASSNYVEDCSADYEDDSDCTKYYDEDLNIYYRKKTQTISVSDDCQPLRNSKDQRVYYMVPQEAATCSAEDNNCREYQGSNAGAVQQVVNEDFSDNTTENWQDALSTSNVSIRTDDYSLRLDNDSTTAHTVYNNLFTSYVDANGTTVYETDMAAGSTYIVTFWAKGSGTLRAYIGGLSTNYYFTETGSTTTDTDANITLTTDEWRHYILGPVYLPTTENADTATLGFYYDADDTAIEYQGYIDNIILEKSNSLYLIKDSFDTCYDYEGCRQYKDRSNTIHYLKSFEELCTESNVGCEYMINTANSSSPFTETYLTENEYETDDVTVPYDQVQSLIYNADYTCSDQNRGCQSIGLPDVNEQTGNVSTLEAVYGIVDPDNFDNLLCEDPQLACREYYSSYDGTVYFKDPGEKICEYLSYTDAGGVQQNGWFKKDTDATYPDCPKRFSYDSPSQPRGAICNSNSKEKAGERCNNDADCYYTSWVAGDPTPRCISRIEDNINQTEETIYDIDSGYDFGWVGTCTEENSGCSEYVDPTSPNIEEELTNSDFEDNVSNNITYTYFEDGGIAENLPDNWEKADTDGDGNANWGSVDGSSECYSQDGDVYHTGTNSMKLTGECNVVSSDPIFVERNNTYTFEAYVRIPEAAQYTDGAATDYYKKFSLGANFKKYDETSTSLVDVTAEDGQKYFMETVDADGQYFFTITSSNYLANDPNDGYSQWLRITGNIGIASTIEIPAEAEYMQLFLYATDVNYDGTSDNNMWFDSLSFKENDKYYMIDYTVDGTVERETYDNVHTCFDQDTEEGIVTADGGCVAFRDVLADTQYYVQFVPTADQSCASCVINQNMDTCRGVINACDTNAVLKVTKDRICSEWLACDTAEIITDDSGNQNYNCFSIAPCEKLNDQGQCTSWITKPVYEDLNYNTDLTYYVHSQDADQLYDIQNYTGYVKVGLTWGDLTMCSGGYYEGERCDSDADCEDVGTCETTTTTNGMGIPMITKKCNGGSNNGSVCLMDAACTGDDDGTCNDVFTIEGYYPYGWMYEAGETGVDSGEELIEFGDFENLYCQGNEIYDDMSCILNSYDTFADPEYNGSSHCYTADMQALSDDDISGNEALEGNPDITVSANATESQTTVAAADYYCPNSPEFEDFPFKNGLYSQAGWQAYTADSSIYVTQYDNVYEDNLNIDTNNVLLVTPNSEDTTEGGVKYDLGSNIQQNGSYSISLSGRFSGDYTGKSSDPNSSTNPSLISIGLYHNNALETTGQQPVDWFVNGNTATDIVFVIDSSGSMSTAITAVKNAAPALASALAAQNLDFKFSVVDMEDTNDIALDFTNDLDEFNTGISNLSADGITVDPATAVMETINNTLGATSSDQLSYRSNSNKYVILVTDTLDERPSTYSIDDAETLVASADVPVIIITDSGEEDYYSNLASYSGGVVINAISSSDWTTTVVEGTDVHLDDKIISTITSSITQFQFDNELKSYSFGPISISQKESNEVGDAITTDLIITNNDGTPFEIDNVSLLPVLETNKSLDSIPRSCRAYSQNTDLACDYTEANGVQHKGWKGYCLEVDPENNNRCITWWPLDIIAGEASLYTKEQGGYSDRSSVYTCLAAKGYEEVGFCESDTGFGEGRMCELDTAGDYLNGASEECGGGRCFSGANYVIQKTHSASGCTAAETAYLSSCYLCAVGNVWSCPACAVAAAIYYPLCTGEGAANDLQNQTKVSYTTDSGTCQVDTNTYSCADYPSGTEFACYPDDATTAAEEIEEYADDSEGCEDAGNVWQSKLINIFYELTDDSQSACINYNSDTVDIDDGDYGETLTLEPDKHYCFYDNDNDDIFEVRTDVTCTAAEDCRTKEGDFEPDGTTLFDAANHSCAPMSCHGTTTNKCDPISCDGVLNNTMSFLFDDICDDSEVCGEIQALDYSGDYKVRSHRWQTYDPFDSWGYNYGVIQGLPANAVERNINISEIEKIDIYLGSAGDGSGGQDEYALWGQKDTLPGIKDKNGIITITDLIAGEIPKKDEGDTSLSGSDSVNGPWDHCTGIDEGTTYGVGCYWWGQYNSRGNTDNLNDYESEEDKYDLVYVYSYSNFARKRTDCDKPADSDDPIHRFDSIISGTKNSYMLDSECIEDSVKYIMGYGDPETQRGNVDDENNPWIHLKNEGIMDQFNTDSAGTLTSNQVESFSRTEVDYSSWGGWEERTGNNQEGGTIYSIYLDFNAEGYLQNIYTLIYDGADEVEDRSVTGIFADVGIELSYEAMIYMDYYLREPCAVVAQVVNNSGDNVAWAQRASGLGNTDSLYNGLYSYDTNAQPWGSISPLDYPFGVEWDSIDELDNDNQYLQTAQGQQPILFYATDDSGEFVGGKPYSCVGKCGEMHQVGGDSDSEGESCESDCGDDCICIGVGEDSIDEAGYGYYGTGTTFADQVAAAAEDGQDRLEHIFADLTAGPYELDFNETTSPYGIYKENSSLWDGTIYENMNTCSEDGRTQDSAYFGNDQEYCGVRPYVDNVAIDGNTSGGSTYTISEGQSIELTFDSILDSEQTELRKVMIDWGDGKITDQSWDAMPGSHVYTHAYNCEPRDANYAYYYESGVKCQYEGTITLVDNWGWCSGDKMVNCSITAADGTTDNSKLYTDNDCSIRGGSVGSDWGDQRYLAGDQCEADSYQDAPNTKCLCGSYDTFPFIISVEKD